MAKSSLCKNADEKDISSTQRIQFWREHILRQKQSGLSKAAYCRKTQIDYARFLYWLKKLSSSVQPTADLDRDAESNDSTFIPVQLNQDTGIDYATRSKILCAVELAGGTRVVIYDPSVLTAILPQLLALTNRRIKSYAV